MRSLINGSFMSRGRPAGEVRIALIEGAHGVAKDRDKFTFRALTTHVRIDALTARRTLANMSHAGLIERAGQARVDGVNRPVVAYRLPQREAGSCLSNLFRCWSG